MFQNSDPVRRLCCSLPPPRSGAAIVWTSLWLACVLTGVLHVRILHAAGIPTKAEVSKAIETYWKAESERSHDALSRTGFDERPNPLCVYAPDETKGGREQKRDYPYLWFFEVPSEAINDDRTKNRIQQLDALASAGLLKRSAVKSEVEGSPINLVRYGITDKGWAVSESFKRPFCFIYGSSRVIGVSEIKPASVYGTQGKELYYVRWISGFSSTGQLDAWARAPEVIAAFPQIKEQLDGVENQSSFVREGSRLYVFDGRENYGTIQANSHASKDRKNVTPNAHLQELVFRLHTSERSKTVGAFCVPTGEKSCLKLENTSFRFIAFRQQFDPQSNEMHVKYRLRVLLGGLQSAAKDNTTLRNWPMLKKAEENGVACEGNFEYDPTEDALHGGSANCWWAFNDDEEKPKPTPSVSKSAARAAQNQLDGMAHLGENLRKSGVKTTGSGLQYEVLREGSGGKPTSASTVSVHYLGRLIDGKQFDSSYKRGNPSTFSLRQVIAGWTEGIQLMSVGSKYRFVIPPQLAYGERGAGPKIPPNSVLIFEVELLSIE